MRRIFYSTIPMILMIIVIVILLFIEITFMDLIVEIFLIEEIESFNTFNNGFILVLGGFSLFFLSKYTREINERIFRIFTYILNFLGIITIMTVVIRASFIN